eukprot:c5657_g1_i1.p1 GENE.c5657_g1_i1~~c5657_g1_i1.p1  ORF type:complete len:210 (+),score=53.43 c5657_g1_i1:44-673(+)
MEPQRFVKSAESRSLWNYTLSPGWQDSEVEILKKCMAKIGVGMWTRYKELGVLPGKNPAQLNQQTQRLIGQQSTKAFTGLHIDAQVVYLDNLKKEGKRKNGMLINEGGEIKGEAAAALRRETEAKYALKPEEYEHIEIPTMDDSKMLEMEEIQGHNSAIDKKLVTVMESMARARARETAIAALLEARGIDASTILPREGGSPRKRQRVE